MTRFKMLNEAIKGSKLLQLVKNNLEEMTHIYEGSLICGKAKAFLGSVKKYAEYSFIRGGDPGDKMVSINLYDSETVKFIINLKRSAQKKIGIFLEHSELTLFARKKDILFISDYFYALGIIMLTAVFINAALALLVRSQNDVYAWLARTIFALLAVAFLTNKDASGNMAKTSYLVKLICAKKKA